LELVLFGIGSPLIVEYEETTLRLGHRIVAGIRNMACESFTSPDTPLRGVEELDAATLAVPCLCPMFTPANRRIAVQEALSLGFAFAPALIDPTAIVASSIEIGVGSFVNSAAIIGGASRIGRHVVINRGVSLGHHSLLGDFVSIGPGAIVAGQVEIGSGAMIGAGAVVLPKIRIGAGAVVGAAAVVTRDVPEGARVMGNPARLSESSGGAKRPAPVHHLAGA